MASANNLPGYLKEQAYQYRLDKARLRTVATTLDTLPTPYPLQQEILNYAAIYKVIAAGRQVGKTMTASMSAIGGERYGSRGLLDGAHVHISSTSQDQADLFWDYITTWLAPLFATPGFYKNESKRLIRYKGGQVRVKTGRNPDVLRGGNVDKLILDECAWLEPDAWRKVGQPMLLARDGVAEFYSSPKRRNWFFELYAFASDPANEHWKAWNFSTLENPHIGREALDRLIGNMSEEDYEQEILAQFLEGQGAVFRYVDERCTTVIEPYIQGHSYVMGVDLAKKQDFTVCVVLDTSVSPVRNVFMDRWHQTDWVIQTARIKEIAHRYHVETVIVDETGVGDPIVEQLRRELPS